MYATIQEVSKKFFETRSEKHFNEYYKHLQPIIFNCSKKILRCEEKSMENVNKVFTKIYSSNTYIFDETKSHLGYIVSVARTMAMTTRKKELNSKIITESSLNTGSDEFCDILIELIDFNNNIDHHSEEINSKFDGQNVLEDILDQISKSKNSDILCDAIISEFFDNIHRDVNNENLANRAMKDIEHYKSIFEKYNLKFSDYHKTYKDITDNNLLSSIGCLKTRVCREKKKIRENINRKYDNNGINFDGINKEYYPCGSLKTIYNLSDNLLNGKKITYSKDGNIISEHTYKEGKRNGDFCKYYNNGKLKIIGNYKDDQKNGICEEYNKEGKLDTIYDYLNGCAYYEMYENNSLIEYGII